MFFITYRCSVVWFITMSCRRNQVYRLKENYRRFDTHCNGPTMLQCKWYYDSRLFFLFFGNVSWTLFHLRLDAIVKHETITSVNPYPNTQVDNHSEVMKSMSHITQCTNCHGADIDRLVPYEENMKEYFENMRRQFKDYQDQVAKAWHNFWTAYLAQVRALWCSNQIMGDKLYYLCNTAIRQLKNDSEKIWWSDERKMAQFVYSYLNVTVLALLLINNHYCGVHGTVWGVKTTWTIYEYCKDEMNRNICIET